MNLIETAKKSYNDIVERERVQRLPETKFCEAFGKKPDKVDGNSIECDGLLFSYQAGFWWVELPCPVCEKVGLVRLSSQHGLLFDLGKVLENNPKCLICNKPLTIDERYKDK